MTYKSVLHGSENVEILSGSEGVNMLEIKCFMGHYIASKPPSLHTLWGRGRVSDKCVWQFLSLSKTDNPTSCPLRKATVGVCRGDSKQGLNLFIILPTSLLLLSYIQMSATLRMLSRIDCLKVWGVNNNCFLPLCYGWLFTPLQLWLFIKSYEHSYLQTN